MQDRYARWWRREGSKSRFSYLDAQGRRITSAEDRERIRALRIPPAWTNVRISPSPRAKLQAVGFDQKGRRQYIYHPSWVAKQSEAKYAKLVRFVQGLPHFRAVTSAHLAEPGLGKQKVLALVSRLIHVGGFRIGGERYAKENRSFGIATLRNRHLQVSETYLRFTFTGKRGIKHSRVIPDREITALVEEIKALPGPRLFQYRKEDGTVVHVTGRDVNAYIKSIMGPEFSAKDFRTWDGTLMAARVLAAYGPTEGVKQRKAIMTNATRAVARFLGNTPAIARASYICPRVFEAYEQGLTIDDLAPGGQREVKLLQAGYTCEEIELMALLTMPPGQLPPPRVSITLAPEAPVASVTAKRTTKQ